MTERLYYLAAVAFQAARHIASLPFGHRLRNLHGHSFLARIVAALPPNWAPFPGGEIDQLKTRMATCLAPLDYGLLNDHLAVPSDENLVRWIRQHLDVPGIETVGIQSTRDQGVVGLGQNDRVHCWQRFRFESAHQLPNVPLGHQCGRMHGHGFELILDATAASAEHQCHPIFDRLNESWTPLYAELHHACLNDIPGLENPTSELLAAWIWRRLKPALPSLAWISVYETATAGCHFDGAHYRIWKERHFESALRLRQAPEGDSRRRLHGHSYIIRLHLGAPLDQIMGWTVDYGDVKELFQPLYQQLDHHRLDRLEGLADNDPASLLRWIRVRMQARLPLLNRIDLYETPDCGALLSWGEPTRGLLI